MTTDTPITPQVIQQALMSVGFHRYFANPQQAMAWPGTEQLAKLILQNAELKAEITRLTAENAQLKANHNQALPQTPVQPAPSGWDDVPPPTTPLVAQVAPQTPVAPPAPAPATTTVKRRGVTIQGVDPIEVPAKKHESPYDSATSKCNGGLQSPPSFALPQGASGSATSQESSSQVNPHFIGNQVPPAPDPQEFVLDLNASEQPSPQSAPALALGTPPQAQLTASKVSIRA